MTEYIKREDAIEQARRNWIGEGEWIASTEIQLLKNLPSADVVEVVRCKDCVMCVEYMGNMFCGYQSFLSNPAGVSANDYCSRGEREQP